ncbi:MAG: glycosyltransferase family 2 protein [Anaerolineae bacterium]|jgi:glycosyltransferase involved in cell wall biosynthesis|nr:glycosyltransferase family 2 protein [Anaerolineae bacterium]
MTITNYSLPAIAIVTPSFEQGKYLEAAMKSVLEQSYPFLEYIVIDGGSKDGSVEIIEKYADQLHYWVSEPDEGQSDAINKGFRRTDKAIIVGWLNSDDILLPDTLLKVVRTFQANPDAVLVYGDVQSIDAEGRVINQTRFNQYEVEDLMQFNIICQPAVFTRLKIVNALGGVDPSYHFLMDHHLWLRLAMEGDIIHIPEFLAQARYHEDAKNVAQAANFGVEAFKLVGWMRSNLYLHRIMGETNLGKRVESAAHRFNARYLMDANKNKEAFHEYWMSFKLSPRTCLKEWHRWLFTMLALFGLGFLKKLFYGAKRAKYKKAN